MRVTAALVWIDPGSRRACSRGRGVSRSGGERAGARDPSTGETTKPPGAGPSEAGRYRRALRLVLCAALALGAAACDASLGPPRKQPLPALDNLPARRTAEPRPERLASYRIEARYDAATHKIEATQVLTWTNGGQSSVETLPFHLYLNGFKNESSLFMRSSGGRHRGERADERAWGWIEVPSIRIGALELRAKARHVGPDETVLEVPLPEAVAPGATVEVGMTFTAQLPRVFARTGYQGAFAMVAQWFPKVGVRVGSPGFETWHCPPFHVNTEFFADFGVYDVNLTVPQTHVVAATGVLAGARDNDDGTRLLSYRAEDVHDFAWMIDPYMEVLTGTAKVGDGTVLVRVVHRARQRAFARRHLAAAIGAVEHFSELFVPYPWSVLTVIDPPPEAGGAAGMEYPTLVTTAGDHVFMRDGIHVPEYVTIHEVGHNWFQGILASNEFEEAYLDEGVNEWADAQVMMRMYGEKASAMSWMGWTGDAYHLRRALDQSFDRVPSAIATAAYAFVDFEGYAAATYHKTSAAMRTLEKVVGSDRFAAAMKHYAQTWAFKHPSGGDLVAALEASLGEDLRWFWAPAFFQPGGVDFTVRSAECQPVHEPRGVFGEGASRKLVSGGDGKRGGWRCDVVVANTGIVPVPVDVEMRFADGSHQRERWDARDGSRWHRFTLERSSPLVEVWVDPDGDVLLSSNPLDDHVRLTPDTRASWRASARVVFWTQGLMQGVAP